MTATETRPVARATRVGLGMAVLSAFTFGSSGPMAKALIESGWTSAAAVLVRIGGAALLLGAVALVVRRGRVRVSATSLRHLVVYGIVAMAGVQLAFFNAVRTLDVGVALLLEFTAPVLLVLWTALRTRTLPARATMLGAALTVVGLVLVLDLAGAGSVDPVGVAWGMLAAVCVAAFFVLSERQHDDLPPLVMAAGGTLVGAIVIALAGAIGLVPIAFTAVDVVLVGIETAWWVPALWLVAVSTAVAYLAGIGAVQRLGTRLSSFVGLTEVLFAVLTAWVLLSEVPGPRQVLGAIAIVGGIVVVRRSEARVVRDSAALLEPGVAP
ncbi:DMT family transporter [Egicoccus sp. AB-alg6-2]|uniref:EamA family transporter n=1 Tax=Egicoccus sp. AB-alg6-2 TaxID=3242692 RepID=UPI00359DB19C